MRLLVIFLFGTNVFANDPIKVTITSMKNIRGNGAIEVCGTAEQSGSSKTILVTVKHEGSKYTTLTSSENEWCTLIKRANYSGNVEVSGSFLN